jgi:hypothetical protein
MGIFGRRVVVKKDFCGGRQEKLRARARSKV